MSINDLFSKDLKKKEEKKEKSPVTVPEGTPETPLVQAEVTSPITEEVPEQETPKPLPPPEEELEQVSPATPDTTTTTEVPAEKPSVTDLFSAPEETTEKPAEEETPEQPTEEEVVEEPAPATAEKPTSAADLFAPQETPAATEPVSTQVVQPQVEGAKPAGLFTSQALQPVIPLPTPILPDMPAEFDVSSDKGGHGKVFMIYGEKGESKTTLALSFPGKIYAISFDRKTTEVWLSAYKGDKRIDVKDALRYMNWSSPEARLKSADISLRYIDALLDEAKKFEPDWIVIDATGGYTKMAEMTMRYRNNIGMTEGVVWGYWSERRLYIKQLHLKALGIAKRGLIYTAFVGVRETIENNKIVKTMEQPKWVDVVKDETDVAIRVHGKITEDGVKYSATIDSSKWRPIKTGIKVDITIPEGETPDCFDKIVEASKSKE